MSYQSTISNGDYFNQIQAETAAKHAADLQQEYEALANDYADCEDLLDELSSSNQKLTKKQKKLKKKAKKEMNVIMHQQQVILRQLDQLSALSREIPALVKQLANIDTITFDECHYVALPVMELFKMLMICADKQNVDTTHLGVNFFQQSLPEKDYYRLEGKQYARPEDYEYPPF